MKKLSFQFAAQFMLLSAFLFTLNTGCKKEETNPKPGLDKEAYFTITLDGIDYATYGYYDRSSNTPFGGPTISTTTELDSSGKTVTKIALLANNTYSASGSQPASVIQLGNCMLKLGMNNGEYFLPGIFNSFTGNLSDHKIINDKNEEFYFEPGFCNLFFSRLLTHPTNNAKMIEGYFICRLFTSAGGFRYINTTGYFRMYSK